MQRLPPGFHLHLGPAACHGPDRRSLARPGTGVRRQMADSANRDQRRAGDSPLAAACSPVAWEWPRVVMVELVSWLRWGVGARELRTGGVCGLALGLLVVQPSQIVYRYSL